MLTHADIYHYKSISEAHIDFSRINIIVGPNGVGKSNLIDAIHFIHDCTVGDIDTSVIKRHGIESIRQWSKTRPFNIVLDFQFANRNGFGRYKVVISSARGDFRVIEEIGEWTGPNPLESVRYNKDQNQEISRELSTFIRNDSGDIKINTKFEQLREQIPTKINPSELYLTALGGGLRSISYLLFRDIFNECASFASYSIYPNTLREPQVVSREDMLNADGSNLASVLKKINSGYRRNKEALLDAIKIILPIVVDIQVRSAGGYYVPVFRIKEPSGEIHELNMSQISDGTLRILGMLTAFYQPNAPDKIALEEPEQMIHPGVLPVIADAGREYVLSSQLRQNQMFITTHSPILLDFFNPEDVLWASFHNGATEFGKITSRHLDLIKRQLFSTGEILVSEGFS
jgi:predicted ATPase